MLPPFNVILLLYEELRIVIVDAEVLDAPIFKVVAAENAATPIEAVNMFPVTIAD